MATKKSTLSPAESSAKRLETRKRNQALNKEASARKAEAIETKVAPAPRARSERGDTVTVACRLPHGFVMQLEDMVSTREPIVGDVLRAQPRPGAKWYIRGFYDDARNVFGSAMPMPSQAGHFALTHGIPRTAWDEWLKSHNDWDAVINGLVFAHSKVDHIEGIRLERKDLKSGLEPINPDRPPRDVRKITRVTADE